MIVLSTGLVPGKCPINASSPLSIRVCMTDGLLNLFKHCLEIGKVSFRKTWRDLLRTKDMRFVTHPQASPSLSKERPALCPLASLIPHVKLHKVPVSSGEP